MNDQVLLLRLPESLAKRVRTLIENTPASIDHVGSKVLARNKPREEKIRLVHSELMEKIWGLDAPTPRGKLAEGEEREAEEFLRGVDEEGVGKIIHETASYAARTNQQPSTAEGTNDVLNYWCVQPPHLYVFQCGSDLYHATRAKLPTTVELHKQTDTLNLVHIAEIHDLLVVHDVKTTEPRPDYLRPNELFHEGGWMDGVTVPMRRAGPDRVEPMSVEFRRSEAGLSLEDVQRADAKLAEFKHLSTVQETSSVASSANIKKGRVPTSYVLEELMQEPAWMEYVKHDISIERPPDGSVFKQRIKALMEQAQKQKALEDERAQQMREQLEKSKRETVANAQVNWKASLQSAKAKPWWA